MLLHLYQDLPYILYSPMSQPVHCDTLELSHERFWCTRCIPIPTPFLKEAESALGWMKPQDLWPLAASGLLQAQLPAVDKEQMELPEEFVFQSMSQCPKCGQEGWGPGKLDRRPERCSCSWTPKSLSSHIWHMSILCPFNAIQTDFRISLTKHVSSTNENPFTLLRHLILGQNQKYSLIITMFVNKRQRKYQCLSTKSIFANI